MLFKHPIYININSEEEFEESDFFGSEKLLNFSYHNLRFATSKEDETDKVSELYFFIEDNGEYIKSDGELNLYMVDDVRFIIAEFDNDMFLVVRSTDLQEITTMFDIE